jgi:hypothetical protein
MRVINSFVHSSARRDEGGSLRFSDTKSLSSGAGGAAVRLSDAVQGVLLFG